MARLTRQNSALHREACALVAQERELTEKEKEFVLDNWQEADTATHGLDGAFFTPGDIAHEVSTEVGGEADRIIDLCAGIGRLAWTCAATADRRWRGLPQREIVCVERNPAYVEVGRKILPEATWICADVLDVPAMGLGRFNVAISNPPFGPIARGGDSPTYTGRRFEYHVFSVAAQLAEYGVFIIPQQSANFRYSGMNRDYYQERDAECERFERETGIVMDCGAAHDLTLLRDQWRGVAPRVELVTADFADARRAEPARAARPTPAPRGARTRSAADLAAADLQLSWSF